MSEATSTNSVQESAPVPMVDVPAPAATPEASAPVPAPEPAPAPAAPAPATNGAAPATAAGEPASSEPAAAPASSPSPAAAAPAVSESSSAASSSSSSSTSSSAPASAPPAVEQPSADALRAALKDLVSAPDFNPDKISAKGVRKLLETKYFPGVDLTPRKKEVDTLVLEAVEALSVVSTSSSSSSSSEPAKKKAKKADGKAKATDGDSEDKKKEKKKKASKKGSKKKKEEEEDGDGPSTPKKKGGKKRKREEAEGEGEGESTGAGAGEEEGDQLFTRSGRPQRRAATAQIVKSAKLEQKNRRLSEAREKRKAEGKTKPGKMMILSDALAEVVGAKQMGRNDVVKKLWEYIKANNLQDPKDKRYVICEGNKLEPIFRQKRINSFARMNKILSSHMGKPEDLTVSSIASDDSDSDGSE